MPRQLRQKSMRQKPIWSYFRTTAHAGEGLQLADLDDNCLLRILLAATRASADPQRAADGLRNCEHLVRVCRRFRDVLLGSAKRAVLHATTSHCLSRFAPNLHALALTHGSSLPWYTADGHGIPLQVAPAPLPALTRLELHRNALQEIAKGRGCGFLENPALRGLADLELHGEGLVVEPVQVRALAPLTKLTRLALRGAYLHLLREGDTSCLTTLQALRALLLPWCGVSAAATLSFVSTLRALTAVDLRGDAHPDKAVSLAAALPALEVLTVELAGVSDSGLQCLSRCSLVTRVSLRGNQRVTAAGIAQLAAMPRLRELDLSFWLDEDEESEDVWDMWDMWDEPPRRMPPSISRCRALEALTVTLFDASEVRSLAGLARLTRLSLQLQGGGGPSEFDGAVAALSTLTSLASLCLAGVHVSAAACAAVASLRKLTELTCRWCEVGEDALGVLRGSPALATLALQPAHVSEAGLRGVSSLAALQSFSFSRPYARLHKVTGGLLSAFGALRSLTCLKLDLDTVANAELAAVSTLTTLRELALVTCCREDVFSSWALTGVAALPSLQELTLWPGGFVDGLAVPRLVSLQELSRLLIRVGFEGSPIAGVTLACGLPKLRELRAAFAGMRGQSRTQLTAQPVLPGWLSVRAARVAFALGPMASTRVWSLEWPASSDDEGESDKGESDDDDGDH